MSRTDELQEKLSPEQNGNAYLGGIKQAHTPNISLDALREIVGLYQFSPDALMLSGRERRGGITN